MFYIRLSQSCFNFIPFYHIKHLTLCPWLLGNPVLKLMNHNGYLRADSWIQCQMSFISSACSLDQLEEKQLCIKNTSEINHIFTQCTMINWDFPDWWIQLTVPHSMWPPSILFCNIFNHAWNLSLPVSWVLFGKIIRPNSRFRWTLALFTLDAILAGNITKRPSLSILFLIYCY